MIHDTIPCSLKKPLRYAEFPRRVADVRASESDPIIAEDSARVERNCTAQESACRSGTVHLQRRETTVKSSVAAIGLGSNLGDRLGFLALAVKTLRETNGLCLRALSPVYETPPLGYTDQPAFLNMVVLVETELDAEHLLAVCAEAETLAGRQRLFPNGPRTLDADLLLFGTQIRQTTPVVPHPRMHLRRFVLQPLADIAPRMVHPTSSKTITDLLQACPDESNLRLFAQGLPDAVGYATGLGCRQTQYNHNPDERERP